MSTCTCSLLHLVLIHSEPLSSIELALTSTTELLYLTIRLNRNPSGSQVPKKATDERQSKNGRIRVMDLVGCSRNVSKERDKLFNSIAAAVA